MHKFDFKKLVASVALCELAGLLGAAFVSPAILSTWYASLNRPVFAPPDFLFGPVWTGLYFMMGLSLYVIWYKGLQNFDNKRAIALFMFQLSLNVLWTAVFFGTRNIGMALAEMVALWLLIALTVVEFGRISRKAAALMFPYHAWVSFAFFLNYALWVMNA